MLCLGLLSGAAAQASTTAIDFNSDPIVAGLVTSITGTDASGGQWIQYNGIGASTNGSDGYLQLTAPVNSKTGKAVFPDFDHGDIVLGFRFECYVRVGGGSDTPADGFSISYARAGDPAITGDTWNGNGQEEGTTTGIAIGFDAYENDANTDPRALDVWVDGVQILQAPMPTRNGLVTDPTSLQTRAADGSGNLDWAHLIVELATNGQLTVNYKNYLVLDRYQTTYAAGPGQLVMAGRTGGLNEEQDVDNITITTTVAQQVFPWKAVAMADGVAVSFFESGGATVDTTKPATVTLNGGTPLPASRIIRDGKVTSVVWYSYPNLLAAGSNLTVQATVTDNSGRQVSSAVSTVTIPAYATVNPSWGVTGVDTSSTGLRIRTWLSAEAEPNLLGWANGQLAGQHGANLADTSSFTNGGYMNYAGVPNWNYFDTNTSAMAENGNFQKSNGYEENAWPGLIPGANGPNIDNSSAEVLCYVYFPEPGPYKMGVNSDDGFRVTAGPNPSDWGAPVLGEFDGGRGASDTIFNFLVPTAGYYPFRLIWENGGGGANCEWFVQQPGGNKILINDPSSTNSTGIKAYIAGPALPAYVSCLTPYPGEANARPDQLFATITDGSTTVTGTSISLYVNDVSVGTPVVSQSGGVTTVTPPAGFLLRGGASTARLVYSTSGGGPFTNTWSFTAVQPVQPQWAVTGVDTSKPGFKILPWQSGNQPNSLRYTLEQLAGLHGSNQADLTSATDGGFIDYESTINFNLAGSGSAGNFANDVGFPGLWGSYFGDTGNESIRVLCYLKFDHSGLYRFGVNSDDGFVVTAGANPMDWFASVLGQFDGGRGPADTTFPVYVVTPGIYPFQLIWENGNGSLAGGNGAECEWFVVKSDGTKVLLNDPAVTDTGVTAYYAGAVALPAYISVYSPVPGATGVAPNAFSVQLVDASTAVQAGSISVTLNGAPVATAVSQAAGKTMVTLSAPMPPGSNTAQFVYNTTGTGGPFTNTWSFVVVTNLYPALNSAWAVTGVDTARPGFRIRPWQGGSQPNTIEWTERQLAGVYGANNADLSLATDGGYIDYTGVINFDIGTSTDGNFRAPDYPENAFPGIPGGNGITDNASMEVLTFLYFEHPGLYTLGVNSDDAFRVTAGVNPSDLFAPVIGENGGVSDTLFSFNVTNTGYYPFRLIWENGNGGCHLEWFVVQPDGLRIPINDPTALENTGIRAYQAGPTLPAHVALYDPPTNTTSAFPDRILIQFASGSSQVNPASAVLLVDGTPVTLVPTQSGNITTLTATFAAPGLAPGRHTASLTWSDTAVPPHTSTGTWTFSVGTWATLDAAMSVPVTAVDTSKPGFVLKVTQVDPATGGDPGDYTANLADENNTLLAGLYFPWFGSNTADTVTGGASGIPADLGNLWYWSNAVDFNIVGAANQGDFTYDYPLPGIPGVTANANYFAAGLEAYVVFPTTGFQVMSVSSDDGFRVTQGLGITRQAIHVTGPGIDTDLLGVVGTTNNSTIGGSLPVPPVSGPVVYIPYASPFTPTAIDLTNKIGVIQQNQGSLSDPSRWAWYLQTNGALAAILINDPGWGMPYKPSGNYKVTIPVVMTSGYGGQIDFWKTNANLVASVGADAHPLLGEADYGKGMGAVDFGFYVTQPGAYPLRLLYFQGGGDSGFEWTSTTRGSFGAPITRTLLNDSAAAGSLMAYRAVTTLPTLDTITVADSKVTVTWKGAGILQSSPTLQPATWKNVDPQPGINSFTAPITGAVEFYRVAVPVPVQP